MKTRPRGGVADFLIGLTCVAATFVFTTAYWRAQLHEWVDFGGPGFFEQRRIAARYGPPRFSRDAEESIIRDFFHDRRDGVFLDVGANHYRDESNTYYLETVLGWSGVAVDALEEFAADYTIHRPKTRFVAAFASDNPGASMQLFVPDTERKLVASGDYQFTVREGTPGTERQVPTTTLNIVLEQAGVPRIDLLSMDIELAEPRALAGFDIDKYKPALVCVEAHPDVRQWLIDYFDEHNYRLVGKYLRADTRNLYFMPAHR